MYLYIYPYRLTYTLYICTHVYTQHACILAHGYMDIIPMDISTHCIYLSVLVFATHPGPVLNTWFISFSHPLESGDGTFFRRRN